MSPTRPRRGRAEEDEDLSRPPENPQEEDEGQEGQRGTVLACGHLPLGLAQQLLLLPSSADAPLPLERASPNPAAPRPPPPTRWDALPLILEFHPTLSILCLRVPRPVGFPLENARKGRSPTLPKSEVAAHNFCRLREPLVSEDEARQLLSSLAPWSPRYTRGTAWAA